MKVLILNPPAYEGIKFIREGRCEQRLSSFQYVMVPISLPSIAAVLRKSGHEVKIVDSIVENYTEKQVKEEVEKFRPALVLVDMSTATFYGDLETIKKVKEVNGCHLTAIGTHVTSLPEDSLKTSLLDSVIRGEPEETALELANTLDNGCNLAHVKGISFKENGKVITNPARPFIKDLDSLPFPARDLIKNEKYTMPISNRPYTLVITSRGCPNQCIYCTAHQYYGHKLRLRSPQNIIDEIEEVVKEHGVKDITMWSDTFTLDRAFVIDICNEIKKRGLKFRWMANSRVDKVDPELLALMKSSGCKMLSFGVESGCQTILDNVRKKTTIEQIKKAFKWCRQAKIETIAHFVFGLPGETKETLEETLDLLKKIKPDYAQFYGAIPFPGTKFYELAKKRGWLVTKDWSKFELNQNIVSTPSLSVEELRKAKEKAFRAFYFRPAYILKRLTRLRSVKEIINVPKQSLSFVKEWVKTK